MSNRISLNRLVLLASSFEDPEALKLARSEIPIDRIDGVAEVQMRAWQSRIKRRHESEGTCELSVDETTELELIRLKALVTWFRSYFNWTSSMECKQCHRPGKFLGTGFTTMLGENVQYENYHCEQCSLITRFYRFHNPINLLKTRRGRCAEFAIVFSVMCRSLGYRTRFVHDVSDHAWTEVYSFIAKRWIHIDPCEAVVDRPLLYELGWGKKPTYIIAVGIDDIQDVTFRYASNHQAVLRRRNALDSQYDQHLTRQIVEIRNNLISRYSPITQRNIMESVVSELLQSLTPPVPTGNYDSRTSGFRNWTPPNIYFLIPTEQELSESSMTVKYFLGPDEYRTSRGSLLFWDSNIFAKKNIRRSVNSRLGVAFFERIDAAENASITWGIDVPSQNVFIDEIKIQCSTKAAAHSKISWDVQSISKDILTTACNACSLGVILPIGVYKRLFITVTLSGHEDSLFKDKLDSEEPSMSLTFMINMTNSVESFQPQIQPRPLPIH